MTSPRELLESWERQQTAYVQFRESRTLCLLETISQSCGGDDARITVLDIGCGPGSLTNAVLQRFANAQVVAVDVDPVLLRLLRETTPYLDRITIVDADLRDPDIADRLPGGCDAAISATALHWLQPAALVDAYRAIAQALRPGGLMLNADHLLFDATALPELRQLCIDQRERVFDEAVASGARSWDDWWVDALSMPGWEAEVQEYHRRWQGRTPARKVDTQFHLAAMRAAGFGETATIWQWLDDCVVYGRMPAES